MKARWKWLAMTSPTQPLISSADINSISTGNEQRDGHLKSADFFDAEQFPKLTFTSTSMKKTGDDTYDLTGDLTMHGVTKPVTLKAEYGGQMQDFYGQTKAGFELMGVLKRKEFGLTWDGVTEAGGVVVSDDVRLDYEHPGDEAGVSRRQPDKFFTTETRSTQKTATDYKR